MGNLGSYWNYLARTHRFDGGQVHHCGKFNLIIVYCWKLFNGYIMTHQRIFSIWFCVNAEILNFHWGVLVAKNTLPGQFFLYLELNSQSDFPFLVEKDCGCILQTPWLPDHIGFSVWQIHKVFDHYSLFVQYHWVFGQPCPPVCNTRC